MTRLFLMLTVILGVLIGYAVIVADRNRRHFAHSADAFACKVRSPRGDAVVPRKRWPVRRVRAIWVHDVLVVRRGLLVPRTTVLAVRLPDDVVREARQREVRGLGRRPLVIRLRLDDGLLVDVAAAGENRTLLVGPFLAAAVIGLPRGPSERPNLGR